MFPNRIEDEHLLYNQAVSVKYFCRRCIRRFIYQLTSTTRTIPRNMCKNGTRPTNIFPSLEPPSIDISVLHKARGSADLKALKLWKDRRGVTWPAFFSQFSCLKIRGGFLTSGITREGSSRFWQNWPNYLIFGKSWTVFKKTSKKFKNYSRIPRE